MAGRTSLVADRALKLYKGIDAASFSATWVSVFTTPPSADLPVAHGAFEWGPPRIRVFPDSGAGSPHWGDPVDDTVFVRKISNVGSLQWLSITLTVSPSTVLSFGIFDAATGGNLLTWGTLDASLIVADAQDIVLATGTVQIKGE